MSETDNEVKVESLLWPKTVMCPWNGLPNCQSPTESGNQLVNHQKQADIPQRRGLESPARSGGIKQPSRMQKRKWGRAEMMMIQSLLMEREMSIPVSPESEDRNGDNLRPYIIYVISVGHTNASEDPVKSNRGVFRLMQKVNRGLATGASAATAYTILASGR